jgi:catabolite regulation protein CreA
MNFKKILIITSLVILSGCSLNPAQPTTETDLTVAAQPSDPYKIGSVDTAFQLIGADHKIEVGAVPDPKVAGVTCFYSRAKT